MSDPLKQISNALTEETDLFVDGVDVCVTRGADVGGNEVTLRVFGDDDSEQLLGFDTKTDYEEFVSRLISGGNLDYERTREASCSGGDRNEE